MTVQFSQPTENKRIESDYYVEGYATTFEPYVLYYDGNEPIYEQIDRNAFSEAVMNNVILQYDHQGKVLARQTNNTLGLEINDSGLFVWADLSKTQASRELYEEIKTGMVTQMSWRFLPFDDGMNYEPTSRTIHVNRLREVFDVSAVSIPANNKTSIYARSKDLVDSYYSGEQEKRDEELAREKKRKKLLFKTKVVGI